MDSRHVCEMDMVATLDEYLESITFWKEDDPYTTRYVELQYLTKGLLDELTFPFPEERRRIRGAAPHGSLAESPCARPRTAARPHKASPGCAAPVCSGAGSVRSRLVRVRIAEVAHLTRPSIEASLRAAACKQGQRLTASYAGTHSRASR